MNEDYVIDFFSWARMADDEVAAGILDALESVEPLRPTHWSEDEFARSPYDRAAVLDHIRRGRVRYALTLARKSVVKHTTTFVATRDFNPIVLATFDLVTAGCPPKNARDVYVAGDRLAAAVRPELGFVHPLGRALGERAEAFQKPTALTEMLLRDYGLAGLGARTWFGGELTRRIGRKLLVAAAAVVQDVPWGGVVVDLVADPWKADAELLFTKQQEALAALRPSGMFGVYEGIDAVDTKRGPQWTPLEPPATPAS